MALGKLATRNLLPFLTLGGTAGSVALPRANLMANALAISPRHLTLPMRQTDIVTLSQNVLEITFDRPRAIDLVGMLFHTMDLTAKCRLTVAGAGGTLAAPVYQSAWTKVHPRRTPSLLIPWEEPNFWTGQAQVADLDVFRRHCLIGLDPKLVASAIRIELDNRDNDAGFYDLGNLWISSSFTPAGNFDRGRRLGLKARDKVQEGPSGRRFAERRQPVREIAFTWSSLTEAEAWQVYDDCARVGTTGMVIFVPDVANVAGTAREAFPGTFIEGSLAEPVFTFEKQHTVSVAIREIIA